MESRCIRLTERRLQRKAFWRKTILTLAPYLYYTNGDPTGAAKDFIDFTVGPEGRKIVEQARFLFPSSKKRAFTQSLSANRDELGPCSALRFRIGQLGGDRSGQSVVRTAWISDVHLGTCASGAARLLDFLREYDFETLYIVGDLIDIWQMRREAVLAATT